MKEELCYGLRVIDKAYTGELIREYQLYVLIEDWERLSHASTLDKIINKAQDGDLKALYLVAVYINNLAENRVELLDKLGYNTLDDIWQELADKNFVLAQYVVAQKYYLRKDVENAKKWHIKAAENGCVLSQLCLAYILIDEKKYDEAESLLQQACDVPEAQAEINYLKGKIALKKDVISNKSEAIGYFEQAANLGSSAAMNQLFLMYREMPSVRDDTKAFKYATMSAELGDEIGVDSLCECYEKGIGVNQNKKKAFSILENYAKGNKLDNQLKKRYERLEDETAIDIGTQIAARSKIKPTNILTLKIFAILSIILAVGSVVLFALSGFVPAALILVGLLVTLAGVMIYSIPYSKQRNARIEQVNTYPEVAITYNNGSFFVVTNDIIEIKAKDIQSIGYVRTQNRSFVIATLVSSIGTIKIKLNNGNVIVAEQVTNAPESVKIMKKIIKSLS